MTSDQPPGAPVANIPISVEARETAGAAAQQPVKIKITNLNFYYGKFRALENVNLVVRQNCTTAFIGPSGCGKSTLLRTINRMYDLYPGQRAEGEVLLDSEDILKVKDITRLRSRVGMVFQKPTPFPMSIYENIAFGIRLHEKLKRSQMDERVEDALTKAGLWSEVKDKLRQSGLGLSGGQQQRLCIARAQAVNPEVLLMDEPCSALDPISTAKIEELLYTLKETCTVVIVTHNMQQAARVSDYTGFFLMGKMIEFSKTDVLFKTPTEKETEDYITGRFG